MYAEKIAALGLFEDKVPNHVLVNEYEAGQGIMVRQFCRNVSQTCSNPDFAFCASDL